MSATAERVDCPYCGARRGQQCTTRSNKPLTEPHVTRWDALKRRYRSEEMLYELRENDPRFGLVKGDRLVCINYPYDAKVTVLRRLSDGYDPECNQYLGNVKFIGFMADMQDPA